MLHRLALAAALLTGATALAQLPTVLPADAAHRNVRDFGAVGDGVTDDTEAFLAAIESVYQAWEQIYVPPGTYLLSDQLRWKHFLTLRGAGPERTTLKLADGASGFQDREAPRGVLYCRRYSGESHDNVSHSNFVYNLTLDTGADNPGAIGIDFNSHNGGGVSNVRIVDGGNSLTGLSLERDSPGPSLISDVEIRGFDVGIRTRYGVYSMTFERIRLLGQRVVGFYNGEHNATVRDLYSDNAVPAVRLANRRSYGLFVLLGAELTGGGPSATAIEGDGELFVRGLRTSGYAAAIRNGGDVLTDASIAEYSSSTIVDERGAATASLALDHPPTPQVPVEDTTAWTNIREYVRLRDDRDWARAIQTAIDEGATTLYFPNFTNAAYPISTDVILRGRLERIVGLSARFTGGGRLVAENDRTLTLDQVRCDGGFVHRGTAPLVITHAMGGSIETEPGAGDLFVEDWCCGHLRLRGSRAFFSQYDNESAAEPKIVNEGGHLVVVNLKTELPSSIAHTSAGGATEILGGLLYPSQAERPTAPAYRCDGCSFGALHRVGAAGYPGFLVHDGSLLATDFEYGPRFVTRARTSSVADVHPTGGVGTTGGVGSTGGVTVAPSPARTVARVRTSAPAVITDLTGRVVRALGSAGEHEVDCGDWPQGLYLVRVRDEAGSAIPFAVVR